MAAPAPEQPLTFAAKCRADAARVNQLRCVQQNAELQQEIKRVFELAKHVCAKAAAKGDFVLKIDCKALGIRTGQEMVVLPKVAEMLEDKQQLGLSAKPFEEQITEAAPPCFPDVSDRVVIVRGLEISW